jgi:DNA polymerase-3 subunit epsilon
MRLQSTVKNFQRAWKEGKTDEARNLLAEIGFETELRQEMMDMVTASKREGKNWEASALLWLMICGAEKHQNGGIVDSWPYEHLAIVCRKLKYRKGEVMALERFMELSHFPIVSEKLYNRLLRAYKLAGQIEYMQIDGDTVPYHKEKGVPVESSDIFLASGAIVDTETTGTLDDDEAIELAVILFEFNKRSGRITRVIDKHNSLREPTCAIREGARWVHRLRESDVRGECFDENHFSEMFDKADMIFAHNASFDRKYLIKLFPKLSEKEWYCTMNGIKWKTKGVHSKKLQSILGHHGIHMEQRHRAMHDATAVFELLSQDDETTGKPYLFELLKNKYESALKWKRKARFQRWAYGLDFGV